MPQRLPLHAIGRARSATLALVACVLAACASSPGERAAPAGLAKIDHIVVIFQENWSFDGLYGKFPGANGLANAGEAAKQVDRDGRPYARLPAAMRLESKKPPAPDERIPVGLPVGPFDLSQYIAPHEKTGDLVHRFYQQQLQINGGRMDQFVAWSDAGALAMSYYDATELPVGKLAQEYTLADNFFHAAFGGSFLNHQWLICACTPVWPDAPAGLRAKIDENGILIKDGTVTPDGYVVNTAYSVYSPHPARKAREELVPPQTQPTIGDRLEEKGISWTWYSGGWNDALAGKPHEAFQYHHQPFAYFERYADGSERKRVHLKDESDFLADLKGGTLPAVAFVKPLGPSNEHPGYADLASGQQHVADLVRAVQASPHWPRTAIIITYDENGGRWDHVAPPVVDRFGPGARVPAVIVSPYAKRRHIDHTQYDTTSILKLIERRFGLAPLSSRDAAANDLTNAFDFSR